MLTAELAAANAAAEQQRDYVQQIEGAHVSSCLIAAARSLTCVNESVLRS